MLRYFVPILLRYTAFDASLLDLVQPFLDWHVLLRVTVEDWTILPFFVDRLEVKWLDFERIEHRGVV